MSEEENLHDLIEMYFHVMGDGRVIPILEHILEEVGYGDEFTWFVFARAYDDWEEDYFGEEGVCFYFDYPSVKQDVKFVLDYNTFYGYIEENVVTYLEKYPNNRGHVEELLEKIREKYNIKLEK